jgi:hypothetical protein
MKQGSLIPIYDMTCIQSIMNQLESGSCGTGLTFEQVVNRHLIQGREE